MKEFMISIIFLLIFLIKILFSNRKVEKKPETSQVKENFLIQKINSFINQERKSFQENKSKRLLRIETYMTYNILSQQIINITKMKKGKKPHLDYSFRIKGIINHIKLISPDILSLQEVTESSLKDIVSAFDGQKTVVYVSMNDSQFYNSVLFDKKYLLVNNTRLCLDFLLNNFNIKGNKGVQRVDLLYSNTSYIIYNIHMPWRREHDLYKLFILNEIYKDILQNISTTSTSTNKDNIFLLVGDFNSTPNCLLLNFIFLSKSKVIFFDKVEKDEVLFVKLCEETLFSYENKKEIDKNAFIEYIDMSNKEMNRFLKEILQSDVCFYLLVQTVLNCFKVYRHVNFCSSYENYSKIFSSQDQSLEKTYPDFTNYTSKFRKTIDYIIYGTYRINTKLKIGLNSLLELPNYEKFKELNIISLPNEDYYSDHLPISCKVNLFQMTNIIT